MITVDDSSRSKAFSNAISSIRKDRRFPHQVFSGDWDEYLFFDAFVVLSSEFIDVKNLLLNERHASVVAVVNLGNGALIPDDDLRAMFLDRKTTWMDYLSELMGDKSPTNLANWMFSMNRFVCASDVGSWAIYGEKLNDMAAFAFRKEFSHSICSEIQELLKAISLKFPAGPKGDRSFDFDKLVPEWKSTLMAEYTAITNR